MTAPNLQIPRRNCAPWQPLHSPDSKARAPRPLSAPLGPKRHRPSTHKPRARLRTSLSPAHKEPLRIYRRHLEFIPGSPGPDRPLARSQAPHRHRGPQTSPGSQPAGAHGTLSAGWERAERAYPIGTTAPTRQSNCLTTGTLPPGPDVRRPPPAGVPHFLPGFPCTHTARPGHSVVHSLPSAPRGSASAARPRRVWTPLGHGASRPIECARQGRALPI